jgi:hypothetical protein
MPPGVRCVARRTLVVRESDSIDSKKRPKALLESTIVRVLQTRDLDDGTRRVLVALESQANLRKGRVEGWVTARKGGDDFLEEAPSPPPSPRPPSPQPAVPVQPPTSSRSTSAATPRVCTTTQPTSSDAGAPPLTARGARGAPNAPPAHSADDEPPNVPALAGLPAAAHAARAATAAHHHPERAAASLTSGEHARLSEMPLSFPGSAHATPHVLANGAIVISKADWAAVLHMQVGVIPRPSLIAPSRLISSTLSHPPRPSDRSIPSHLIHLVPSPTAI